MKGLSDSRCLAVGSQATHPRRRIFPFSCSTMAKITSIVVLTFILLIIVVLVCADTASNSSNPRSRIRSKLTVLKKKKLAAGVPKAVRIEEPSTTYFPPSETQESAVESEDDSNNGITLDEADINESNSLPVSTVSTDQVEDTQATVIPKVKVKKQSLRSNAQRNIPLPEGCEECDLDECVTPSDSSCPTGLVLDRCSCCSVCGAGEGNRCYNASLNLRYNPDIGICGPGLSCLLRSDLDPTEPPEALCECRDRRVICGSDNQTYTSECKLREVAHSRPTLVVNAWSPCVSAPFISTPVENMTVAAEEDVSMSCEVRGYPPPVIHWEFLAEESNSSPIILPGDDSSVVIVVRGGPEQMMTTSWIQIITVAYSRQGTYFCIAKNTEGMIQSSAFVNVDRN